MQHNLEPVDGGKPGEIENASERFGELPGDENTVGKFLHVARTGHSRFQEHTNGRSLVGQSGSHLCQLIEPLQDDSSVRVAVGVERDFPLRGAKTDGPASADKERWPQLPGKRKCRSMESNFSACELRTVVRIPEQGAVLDAVSGSVGQEAKGAAREVEKVGLAQRAVVQLHDNEVALG